jgi:hypothetical protein
MRRPNLFKSGLVLQCIPYANGDQSRRCPAGNAWEKPTGSGSLWLVLGQTLNATGKPRLAYSHLVLFSRLEAPLTVLKH